jgi:hypothetical protein
MHVPHLFAFAAISARADKTLVVRITFGFMNLLVTRFNAQGSKL